MAKWLTRRGLLAPLQNTVYRHLFFAQVLSLLGTGLATVALALLAYDLAGEKAGSVLGTALAIKMVAYVSVAPVATAFAARFPRRMYLMTLDLVRALVVLTLPLVDQIWHVYVLIFVLQSASASFTPAFRSTIPDVLTDEKDFTKAMSLSRIAYDMESLLSPSIAAALLSVISFHWLFAGTAIGFIASAMLVVLVILPTRGAPRDDDGYLDRLSRGVRISVKTPRLRGLLAVHFAVAAAGAMVIVNTVVMVRDTFGGYEGNVAIMMAAVGCGSMAMAFALPSILSRHAPRTVMLGAAGFLALGLLAGPATQNMTGLALLWFLIGAAMSAAQTPTEILLSRSATSDDRPSLYAAQFALSHGCWLIAYPAAGWLGSIIGLDFTFIVMAGLAAVGFALALLIWPGTDRAELPHRHDSFEHAHWHVHDEHHQHAHLDDSVAEPHAHVHSHDAVEHSHAFVIDRHHRHWPMG